MMMVHTQGFNKTDETCQLQSSTAATKLLSYPVAGFSISITSATFLTDRVNM